MHLDGVCGIALLPGSNGNVSASACNDEILRFFDIRRSVAGNLLNIFTLFLQLFLRHNKIVLLLHLYSPGVSSGQQGSLRSVAFLPVDPMVLASASQHGTKLFDIRQNTFW